MPYAYLSRFKILLMTIVVLSLGCGNSGDSPVDPPAEFDCSKLSLSTDQALPLDVITLSGVTLANAPIVMLTDTTTDDEFETLTGERDGKIQFVVPFLAKSPLESGEWQVRVKVGATSCDLGTIQVGVLPEAPGALTAFVDSTMLLIDARSIALGTTSSDLLAADFAGLNSGELLHKMVLETMTDPQNLNRYSEIAAGTAPILGGEVNIDLAERVVAKLSMLSSVRNALESLDELNSSAQPKAKTVTDAKSLSEAMGLALSLNTQASGAVSTINADIGMAASVIGLVPHPGVKLASYLIGLFGWSDAKAIEISAASLPSVFTSATLGQVQTVILEDDPAKASWGEFKVQATSKGISITRSVMEGIVQAISLALAANSTAFAGAGNPNYIQDLIELTGLTTAGNVLNDPDGTWDVEPFTWPAIDISAVTWSESSVAPVGGALARDSHFLYEANAVGTAGLIVEARGEKFGGQTIKVTTAVEVKPIEISLTPTSYVADPGEDVVFDAMILNAVTKSMEWEISAGEIEVSGVGSGSESATLTTPVDEGMFPITLTVSSTSDTGLRSESGAPRLAQAIVRLSGATVEVIPGNGCAEPNEQIQFAAEVIGPEDKDVTWTAELGSINANGLYTAPAASGGVDVVRATSVAEPEEFAEATISLSGCSCEWDFTYTGSASGARSGNIAYAPNPAAWERLSLSLGQENEGSVVYDIIAFIPELSGGQTGAFAADLVFDAEHEIIGGRYENDPGNGYDVQIVIEQNTDGHVLGHISGNLVETNHADGTDPGSIVINGRFTARFNDLSGTAACLQEPGAAAHWK